MSSMKTPIDKKREKLPEEITFDKWVYGGISYWAQALTGIVTANWLEQGSGRPHFDKAAEWFGKNLQSKITSKTGEAAAKEAHAFLTVSTMIMVGNAFLIPVKLLENRKPEIIRGMVEKNNAECAERGHSLTPEELAHQQKLLAELEAEPTQSWRSLLKGRAFGLGAVYATLFAIGNDNNQKMAKGLSKELGKHLDNAGAHKLAHNERAMSFASTAFFDFFYSAISSGGLYVYSHLIDPPKECKEPAKTGAISTDEQNFDKTLTHKTLEIGDSAEIPTPTVSRRHDNNEDRFVMENQQPQPNLQVAL